MDYYDNNGYSIKMIDGKVAVIIFDKIIIKVFEGIYPECQQKTLNMEILKQVQVI